MPLNEYLELLKTSNVVLDQCKCYSYGMNALYAMAQSKIVMSGAEPEALLELNVDQIHCPIINIVPNVQSIYDQLVLILDKKNASINEEGNKSRLYVEKYHNTINIAQKYIEIWQK